MKRWSVAAVLVICLVSCHKPPAYESHYVPPTSPPPLAVPSPAPSVTLPRASFVDNFDRPDTVLGLGEGWDMRGPDADYGLPVPAATDGFISNGSIPRLATESSTPYGNSAELYSAWAPWGGGERPATARRPR